MKNFSMFLLVNINIEIDKSSLPEELRDNPVIQDHVRLVMREFETFFLKEKFSLSERIGSSGTPQTKESYKLKTYFETKVPNIPKVKKDKQNA